MWYVHIMEYHLATKGVNPSENMEQSKNHYSTWK